MFAINAKNKTKVYGLTGGIATGKSTVANYLTSKGFLVFNSDLKVSEIWETNKELKDYIKDNYNIDLANSMGKKELAKLIFSNKKVKKEVESLIHPFVLKAISKWVLSNKNEKILFLDIPLLYEIGYENNVNEVIVVYTNRNNQIKRLMLRDNLKIDEAQLRVDAQIDIEIKRLKANYVINNNDTLEELYEEIDKLLKELI